VTARWFDPTSGEFPPVEDFPLTVTDRRGFTPPEKNAAGESDWVLLLKGAP